ncbi:unnamed protein product [Prorocentrum cordatum]|uniref:Uncharacterized protein n=1 Tax=Prorocentrum cordatum TaxID=2364126 RepID=A0ABN9TYU4_9DINO|nr:unnamed protein product [Polarella glacialis]
MRTKVFNNGNDVREQCAQTVDMDTLMYDGILDRLHELQSIMVGARADVLSMCGQSAAGPGSEEIQLTNVDFGCSPRLMGSDGPTEEVTTTQTEEEHDPFADHLSQHRVTVSEREKNAKLIQVLRSTSCYRAVAFV